MGGRARRCVAVPVGVTAGRARAAAAHWLAGLVGSLAEVTALTDWRLDSAAVGNGGARFAVCFLLVVNCACYL